LTDICRLQCQQTYPMLLSFSLLCRFNLNIEHCLLQVPHRFDYYSLSKGLQAYTIFVVISINYLGLSGCGTPSISAIFGFGPLPALIRESTFLLLIGHKAWSIPRYGTRSVLLRKIISDRCDSILILCSIKLISNNLVWYTLSGEAYRTSLYSCQRPYMIPGEPQRYWLTHCSGK